VNEINNYEWCVREKHAQPAEHRFVNDTNPVENHNRQALVRERSGDDPRHVGWRNQQRERTRKKTRGVGERRKGKQKV